MKKKIHPSTKEIKMTCSCGNQLELLSSLKKDQLLDVCSKCHPFYTGEHKISDEKGRVEKYKKRFGSIGLTKNK